MGGHFSGGGKSLGGPDTSFPDDHPHSASDQRRRWLHHEEIQTERYHLVLRHYELRSALVGEGGYSKIGANPHRLRLRHLDPSHVVMSPGPRLLLHRQGLSSSREVKPRCVAVLWVARTTTIIALPVSNILGLQEHVRTIITVNHCSNFPLLSFNLLQE